MDTIPIGLIRILTEEDFSNSTKEEQLKITSYYKYLEKEGILLPYEYITQLILDDENENSLEQNEYFENNIEILIKNFYGTDDQKKIFEENLLKIRRHISLAKIQKEYINRETKQAEDILDKLLLQINAINDQVIRLEPILDTFEEQSNKIKEELNKLKDKTIDVEKNMNKIEETKSNIYTDIIALFGIFSAIVLLGFGGIDFTRAVFDVGSDVLNMPVKKFISIGCLMLIVILTIVYSLLLWIGRLTHKSIGYCMSEECPHGICKYKKKHFFHRHSFYFGLMIVLIALFWVFK